ncbi:MAG: hypothetical protein WCT07_02490 [Candidatus Paceibacterota bacterium]|jgi:hypothetical protein
MNLTKLKTYFSAKYYISFLQRQPKHTQHIAAFIFAGTITAIIAGFTLYTDYGFWHERYQSEDLIAKIATTTVTESPSETISKFWNEAHNQFDIFKTSSSGLLQGKEVYTK